MDRFFKNPQMLNLMQIRPLVAEFHEDSHDEANGRFSQFY